MQFIKMSMVVCSECFYSFQKMTPFNVERGSGKTEQNLPNQYFIHPDCLLKLAFAPGSTAKVNVQST